MANRQHTDAEIIDAFVKHKGILSKTAEELGYSRQQVYNRMNSSESIRAVYESLNKYIGEEIEDCIVSVATDTKHKDWFSSARYYSRVKMGWVEKQHIDVTTGDEKIEGFKVIVVSQADDT